MENLLDVVTIDEYVLDNVSSQQNQNRRVRMAEGTLFDAIGVLKKKFQEFFVHKKKYQALENYSTAVPFQHKDYLLLIKRCMADGFLGEKEAEFLCYLIDKYQVNFLDWSHKTKWLKSEIERLSAHYQKPIAPPESTFDYTSLSPTMDASVPFELLAQHQKQQMARRA